MKTPYPFTNPLASVVHKSIENAPPSLSILQCPSLKQPAMEDGQANRPPFRPPRPLDWLGMGKLGTGGDKLSWTVGCEDRLKRSSDLKIVAEDIKTKSIWRGRFSKVSECRSESNEKCVVIISE
ncbi:MAG: hypothetical protein JW896_10665 [Deltaproteobacteria bacterium]|nr:hypothetical protein [Deltaproteobacteria bacterium]